jgi:hypothetical protein
LGLFFVPFVAYTTWHKINSVQRVLIETWDNPKRIFLLDGHVVRIMDFINHRAKRLSPHQDDRLELGNRVPNIVQSEVEQLNSSIFKSIKMRSQNMEDTQNNQQGSFKKMVDQTRGQDISNIANLTRDFEKKTRLNY